MADYNYLVSSGVIVPDTSATRANVEAEFREIFGSGVQTDPATPTGQMITRIVEERDAVARNNAELANQINPDVAGGIFLDSIWRLSGGARRAAKKSLIAGVVLGGVPGTLVAAGSLAKTVTGDSFELVSAVTIGAGGTVTGSFQAMESGAISAGPGTLVSVASSVLGWETVTNPFASTIGQIVESDAGARRRRNQTMAIQTISVNEAVTSRLYEFARSVNFMENFTSSPAIVDGINLLPHSVWACVDGGTDEQVANALFESKTAGAAYNGAISVMVEDNFRFYEVKFDRPSDIVLLVRVTVRPSVFDAMNLIPELVMNWVNGDVEGDEALEVGKSVSPWEISGAINQQEPSLFVRKVELSLAGSGVWTTEEYSIGASEVARILGKTSVLVTVSA